MTMAKNITNRVTARPKPPAGLFEHLLRAGSSFLHDGQAAAAASILERARKINPDSEDAALNLSGAYILSGKFKQAAELLEKKVAQNPENSRLWINLGAATLGNPVLATDEQQSRAIAAFERALDLDPVAPSVAYNIALICRDRQEAEKAVQWLHRALQTNPNDQDAARLLARLAGLRAATA